MFGFGKIPQHTWTFASWHINENDCIIKSFQVFLSFAKIYVSQLKSNIYIGTLLVPTLHKMCQIKKFTISP